MASAAALENVALVGGWVESALCVVGTADVPGFVAAVGGTVPEVVVLGCAADVVCGVVEACVFLAG